MAVVKVRFGKNRPMKGSGEEERRIDAIKAIERRKCRLEKLRKEIANRDKIRKLQLLR